MIKKLTVLLIAFILCAGVFAFPACGKEELLSLEYENSVVVQFLDPCGTFYVNTALGYQTEYSDIKSRSYFNETSLKYREKLYEIN